MYEATQLEASIATGAPDYLDPAAIDSIIRSKDALYSVLLGHHGNVNTKWHTAANTKRVRRMCMGYSEYLRASSRQLAAIATSCGRIGPLAELRRRGIDFPVVAIHGTEDILVPVKNGRIFADRILGAKCRVVAGMGHLLCPEVRPELLRVFRAEVLKPAT